VSQSFVTLLVCALHKYTQELSPTPRTFDEDHDLEWTNRVSLFLSIGTCPSAQADMQGSTLAIGTNRGIVEIWDAEYCKRIRTMTGHTARVGALAWNNHILSSGSRDRTILHRDTRAPEQAYCHCLRMRADPCPRSNAGHILPVCDAQPAAAYILGRVGHTSHVEVWRAPSCHQGHRMESASARCAGQWRRYGG
jgi:WD40 repeat protein